MTGYQDYGSRTDFTDEINATMVVVRYAMLSSFLLDQHAGSALIICGLLIRLLTRRLCLATAELLLIVA